MSGEVSKLDELSKLNEIVQKENHLKFLDINPDQISDAEIGFDRTGRLQSWKRLVNAVNSIEDVKHSKEVLPFVGFLGHFSSGKSSLINAYLDLGSSSNGGVSKRRQVGQHPTDSCITLICDVEDVDSIGAAKLASINNVEIMHVSNSESLKGKFLVDTPGLGNTAAEYELAEQFLHLCHVIVITIDGSVPIGDTEKGLTLFLKAISQLSGVPKIFAITKSVNFLTSRKGDYDTDWDAEKASDFWNKTIQRIVSIDELRALKDEVNSIPHVFVDSVDDFKIDALDELIIEAISSPNQQERVFNAKTQYLLQVGRESAGKFRDFLRVRIENLEELLSGAKQRSDVAKNSINTQIRTLQDSIDNTSQRLNQYHESIRHQNSRLLIPDMPSILYLTERSEFDGAMNRLGKVSQKIEDAYVHRITHELRLAVSNIYRLRGPCGDLSISGDIDIEVETLILKKTQSLRAIRTYFEKTISSLTWSTDSDEEYEPFTFRRFRYSKVLSDSSKNVQAGLEEFIEHYNSSAEHFVAYLAQPNSKKLLADYGITLFDGESQIKIRASQLSVRDFPVWSEIERLVLNAMDEISKVTSETESIRASLESGTRTGYEYGPFGDGFELSKFCELETRRKLIEPKIAKINQLISANMEAALTAQKQRRMTLQAAWSEFAATVLEFIFRALVVFGLGAVLYSFAPRISPALYSWLLNQITIGSESVIQTVIASSLGALLSFVFLGPRGSGRIATIVPPIRATLAYLTATRQSKFELIQQLNPIQNSTLNLNPRASIEWSRSVQAIIEDWVRNSVSFEQLRSSLEEIDRLNNKMRDHFRSTRSELLAKFQELQKSADTVANEKRKQSIENVLQEIGKTKEAIEGLSTEIEGQVSQFV